MQALRQQRRRLEIEQTMRQLLQAKDRILVAELTQGFDIHEVGPTERSLLQPGGHLFQLLDLAFRAVAWWCDSTTLRTAQRVLAVVGWDREYLVD